MSSSRNVALLRYRPQLLALFETLTNQKRVEPTACIACPFQGRRCPNLVEHGSRRNLIVLAIMLAVLLEMLDTAIVNVALPGRAHPSAELLERTSRKQYQTR